MTILKRNDSLFKTYRKNLAILNHNKNQEYPWLGKVRLIKQQTSHLYLPSVIKKNKANIQDIQDRVMFKGNNNRGNKNNLHIIITRNSHNQESTNHNNYHKFNKKDSHRLSVEWKR